MPADFPGIHGVPEEFKGPDVVRVVVLPGIGPECDDEDAVVVVPGALRLLVGLVVDGVEFTGMLSILPSSPDFLMSPPV